MSYASISEIQSEFRSLNLSATTSVSTDEVTRFLEEADALINSFLEGRYSTPITGTNALLVIKQIEIDLVTSRISKVLKIKQPNLALREDTKQGITDGSLTNKAMRMLKMLQNGDMTLSDATAISTTTITKNPVPSTYCPTFEKSETQW